MELKKQKLIDLSESVDQCLVQTDPTDVLGVIRGMVALASGVTVSTAPRFAPRVVAPSRFVFADAASASAAATFTAAAFFHFACSALLIFFVAIVKKIFRLRNEGETR